MLLLIDVSGSLRAHSPDLLRFAHAVIRSTERAEAFTFGTRLTRVTRALDTPDVDTALAAVADVVRDADGGTRIGPALLELLSDGRHVALARGALIIVLSDGLERGDPAAMARGRAPARPARPPAGLVVAARLRPRLPAGDARHAGGARASSTASPARATSPR